jgi:uncharacterized protein involved in response to NO
MNTPHAVPFWLSGGFRPFFLLGALAMALSVLVWILVLTGAFEIPTAFTPRDWHVHTVLLGAIPAIIAGFALTAVSNWTGRPLVAGGELLALVLLWLAGRVAVSTSALLGPVPAAIVDMLFPLALALVFAREVIAAGNYRNLRIVGLVALLGATNAAFHAEAFHTGSADVSLRAAIAVVLILVMLVGGRIIPAFTRNWLMARMTQEQGAERLPAPFSRFDVATLAVSAAALAGWAVLPTSIGAAALLVLAGGLNALRLSRWCGPATWPQPLLSILHVGYATIPIGFLTVAASILAPDVVDPTAAVHVWTAGTFGAMTLAVMTRASRGHSG